MTTLPEPPRTPLVDPVSGMLARPWVRFFDDLRRAIVSGLDVSVGNRLDQLEADSLFESSGQTGTGSDYNDTALRARIDSLETELLWLATDSVEAAGGDGEATDAVEFALIADMMTPAPASTEMALKRLATAVRDLETAQAMATDAAGVIAALTARLQSIETEGAWS